jgi:glycosyltransferase involved in cell wall biosynthesis
MSEHPRVSIGVPVFNGDLYLSKTLDSILSQTYQDFRLVICDNASTDRTEAICRYYAQRDRRVHYVRNLQNIGASANFNKTFELSSGEYFKWAAHDDLLAPTFIERCVAALDADRDAVLALPLVRLIDGDGALVALRDYDRFHLLRLNELQLGSSPDRSERFAVLARQPRPCWHQFGLIRRGVLARTSRLAPYLWSDVTLCAELALLGRIVVVPEVLFFNRDHPGRFTTSTILDRETSLRWWCMGDGGNPRLIDLCPNWQIQINFWRIIQKHVADPGERRRTYLRFLRHLLTPYVLSRLIFEPIAAVDPRVHRGTRQFKAWLQLRTLRRFGPASARAGLETGK